MKLTEILGNGKIAFSLFADAIAKSKSIAIVGEKKDTKADVTGITGDLVTVKADKQTFNVGADCLFKALIETDKQDIEVSAKLSSRMLTKLNNARSRQQERARQHKEEKE